jgi:hypothetical protein
MTEAGGVITFNNCGNAASPIIIGNATNGGLDTHAHPDNIEGTQRQENDCLGGGNECTEGEDDNELVTIIEFLPGLQPFTPLMVSHRSFGLPCFPHIYISLSR